MKSKIFRLIDEMHEEEFKRFVKFLGADFFNKNKKLLKIIKARSLSYTNHEELHRKIFPGIEFNKQVFKNMLTSLMKLYKKFLAIRLLDENPNLMESLAKERAREEGVEELLGVNTKATSYETILDNSFLSLQFLERNEYEIINKSQGLKTNFISTHKKFEDAYLLQEVNQFAKRTNILCDYIFFQRKYPTAIKSIIIEKAIKHYKAPEALADSILVQLYQRAFLLAESPSNNKYNDLKNLYLTNIDRLHPDYIGIFSSLLGNYCVAQVNNGIVSFNEELFDLYVKRSQINENKKVTYRSTINFVVVGCRVSRIDTVLEYLEKIKHKINDDVKDYCSAIIKYYSKDYSQSLTKLQRVNFDSERYQLSVKYLVIQNLYALHEYEAALSQIESLRIFLIRTNSIAVERKNNNLNFLKFFKMIIDLKDRAQVIAKREKSNILSTLVKRINNCSSVINKNYLLGIMNEI